jgi:amino acid adenylation domain-containing protein
VTHEPDAAVRGATHFAGRATPLAGHAAAPSFDEILDRSNLSTSQFLLWLGQRLHPTSPLYNMVLAFDIEGVLDPLRFDAAFTTMARRSDALRTVFDELDGIPVQRVGTGIPAVEHVDLSSARNPGPTLRRFLEDRAARPFDPGRQLVDTALVRLAPDHHVWYLNQHHLITDAWATALVYRQVADLYGRLGESGLQDSPAPPQYADYVAYERRFRQSAVFRRVREHWLRTIERPVQSPTLYGRTGAGAGTRSARVTLDLGRPRSERIRALAGEAAAGSLTGDAARFTVYATTLLAYLHRVSGQSRLSIGTPSHNRPSSTLKETIGAFIELFPLVVDIEEEETFRTLLDRVRAATQSLLRYAQPGASSAALSRSFNVVLNYIHATFPPFDGLPMRSEWIHPGHGDSRHHLRLQVQDFDATGSVVLHLDFNEDVFDSPERDAAAGHFLRVLDSFLDDPARPLRNVDLLTVEERQHLLAPRERAPVQRADAPTIVALIEAQARRTPAAVALSFGEHDITYAELLRRAGSLAHLLRAHGIRTESRVGIHLERSPDAVVAVLGVLLAGAAYVPIDPDDPRERIAFLLRDAGVDLLLTSSAVERRLPRHDVAVLRIDEQQPADVGFADDAHPAGPDNAAYVLYTSGSTGRPKGVVVEHASLANYILWAREFYLRGRTLDFALFTSLSFDLTVTSLFLPLVSGGRIVIHADAGGGGAATLLRVLDDDRVTAIKLTPSHLSLLSGERRDTSPLRLLIVGGEDLKTAQARTALNALGDIEIYNEYGPTEATVGCMIHRYDPERDTDRSVPIGRAAGHARIYLLDAALNPVPPGVVGEIFVAGPGVARSYLDRPEVTAERFLPDPFAGVGRMYRTGDLGRWQADGVLQFLGRADDQIKIRGARVEPGEIEAVLLTHPSIDACVVDLARSPISGTADAAGHCQQCGLPSNYPGATFGEDGICHLCRGFDGYRDRVRDYFRSMDDLHRVFTDARARRTGEFDCLMLLSGGKDSTYALCQLVEMGVSVLAFTLDNGYIAEGAKANIRRVTESLGVEHVFGTTPAMNAIFVESLKQHANVCNGCFKTIYTLGVRTARAKGIPIVVTGLSRGQFFETRLTEELFTNDAIDAAHIDRMILEARKVYHRTDDAVARLLDTREFQNDALFDDVQFIDFYRYCDVDLDEMLAYLDERIPWIRPEDTGRSTNCLINDVGIYVHRRQRGFHNYAFPYSWDVRVGHKTRAAAIDELNDAPDPAAVRRILGEIGYDMPAAADDGERNLVAYCVSESPLRSAELRQHLAASLPSWMIPSRFVRVDRLPLTPHGKVDRAELRSAAAARVEAEAEYVAPRNAVERQVASIWSDVLGVGRVGVQDGFLELGGNSLNAIRIISRVNDAFGIELPLQSAFEASTVAALAALVEGLLQHHTGADDIPRRAARTHPAMSAGQRRLWFLYRLDPAGAAYNMYDTVRIEGPLDAAILEAALNVTIARHEVLRTGFEENDGRPIAVVHDDARVAVRRIDLSTEPADALESRARELASAEVARPFDLSAAPLVRALLLRLRDSDHVLTLTLHHIVADEWSLDVIRDELSATYAAMLADRPADLPAGPVQYADYAAWQQSRPGSPAFERQLAWWRERFSEVPAPLSLTADGRRPSRAGSGGGTVSRTLSPQLSARVAALARAEQVTPFVLLLAAFATLLHRYTDATDIVIGTPATGRSRADVERSVGFFINTLPLRTDLTGDPPFREVIERVREVATGARANQDVPFDALVDALGIVRSIDSNPLFQVMFVMRQAPRRCTLAPGLATRPFHVDAGSSKFDLTLFATDSPDALELMVEYASHLFDRAYAECLLEHLEALLDDAASDPARRISALNVLSTREERMLLEEWSTGPATMVADDFVDGLIQAEARRAPGAIALRANGRAITYAELDARANALANRLLALGVGPGQCVGVYADRSAELVIGVIGVLKAGGAYVPLDPAWPRDRLRFIVDDTRAGVVVAQRGIAGGAAWLAGRIVDVDAADPLPIPSMVPSPTRSPADTAYVIHTSGSTGRPKGVPVTHASLVHSTAARRQHYGAGPERFLLLSSFAFDSSVAGIFWTLCTGGTLVLPAPRVEQDIDQLVRLISAERITHTLCLPTLYALILEHGDPAHMTSLQTVIVAGEACAPGLARRHHEVLPHAKLHNEYGPTEATVWSTVFTVPRDFTGSRVPIGRPTAGTRVYVLDAHRRPVPIGVPGELFIGGRGIAREYLQRPEETAYRFVDDPFAEGSRLYRTGDRVRWLGDGTLDFLGRIDRQVKIRGYRIEPAEIESVLLDHPAVHDCVVVMDDRAVDDSAGVDSLVAALVALGEDEAGRLLDAIEGSATSLQAEPS